MGGGSIILNMPRKIYFLIEFDELEDRDATLDSAPWFYGQKHLYTFPQVPNFDVTTGHYNMLLM